MSDHQNTEQSDVGLLVEINDGPSDKPNFKRIVKIVGWDTMPGTVLCWDIGRCEMVRVDRQKIEEAKAEAFGLRRKPQ